MRLLAYAALAVAALFLLTGAAEPVSAGVEPSPFRGEAARLDSIATRTETVLSNLETFLTVNPPLVDEREYHGGANRLMAMGDRLAACTDMLHAIMEGMEWDDYKFDPEVMGALLGILNACGVIIYTLWVAYFFDFEDGFIRWPWEVQQGFVYLNDAVQSLNLATCDYFYAPSGPGTGI